MTNGGQHENVGHIGIAHVHVIFVRVVDGAKHTLEGNGHAGDAVVLEHRQIDHGVANLGEGFRNQASNTSESGQLIFESQRIVSETADPGAALDDLEARAFEVGIQPVPNDDFLDTGLLETFADGIHQLRACGIASAGKAIHFEPDHLAGPRHLPPGLQG